MFTHLICWGEHEEHCTLPFIMKKVYLFFNTQKKHFSNVWLDFVTRTLHLEAFSFEFFLCFTPVLGFQMELMQISFGTSGGSWWREWKLVELRTSGWLISGCISDFWFPIQIQMISYLKVLGNAAHCDSIPGFPQCSKKIF